MRRMENVKSLSWKESAGFISMEYAYLYPPGIPLIVPGNESLRNSSNVSGLSEQRVFCGRN